MKNARKDSFRKKTGEALERVGEKISGEKLPPNKERSSSTGTSGSSSSGSSTVRSKK